MNVVLQEGDHTYVDIETGLCLPHVTGMLEETGWVSREQKRFMTQDGRERGTSIHLLTQRYDEGQIEVVQVEGSTASRIQTYAHVVKMVRPQWRHIEEVFVSERYRYATKVDRVGLMYKRLSLAELKTGKPIRPLDVRLRKLGLTADSVQTALQAIAVGERFNVQPETIDRYGIYLWEGGDYKVKHFDDRLDFEAAHEVIVQCCY